MTTTRTRSASPYETEAGFARALRVGDRILVAGTAPIGPYGDTWAAGDAYEQTKRCFAIAEAALRELGGTLAHTVRTRIFFVRREDWPAIAKAHGELFEKIGPVACAVQVAGLVDPTWSVEIELEADINATPRE